MDLHPSAPASPYVAPAHERPGCITTYAILQVIGGLWFLLPTILSGFTEPDIGAIVGAGLALVVAYGLWHLKNWARILVIVLISFNLILFAVWILSGQFFGNVALLGLAIVLNGYVVYWFVSHGEYFD